MKDALTLLYDIPVDRIALKMLLKAPEWAKLPNFEEAIRADNTPRIRPEDITDIFRAPPWREGQPMSNQIPDHRLKKVGIYTILGFADCSHAKYKRSKSAGTLMRGRNYTVRREHFWWVMEPDGSVQRTNWNHLRRLQPGESVLDMIRRKQVENQSAGLSTTTFSNAP